MRIEKIRFEINKVVEIFNIAVDENMLNIVTKQSLGDLETLLSKDLSLNGEVTTTIESNLFYKSTLLYRLSHQLFILGDRRNAVKIAEYAKLMTGVEIHPAAKIGKKFVIDHGIGTVIGETAEIGDNCYILQDVIIGSKEIAIQTEYYRHPIIGNPIFS